MRNHSFSTLTVFFSTHSAREKQFSQYASEIYSTDAGINGLLNVILRVFFFFFSNNFLQTFISLMTHRKCKVCLPFLSHRMPNRCRSNCFTFLTDCYAFVRLVGVLNGIDQTIYTINTMPSMALLYWVWNSRAFISLHVGYFCMLFCRLFFFLN